MKNRTTWTLGAALSAFLTASAATAGESNLPPPLASRAQENVAGAWPKPGTAKYGTDDERIVLIYGKIDREMTAYVIKRLRQLNSLSSSAPIAIHINSGGGEVDEGLAIYDFVTTQISNPISTLCIGEAQSMGAFLLTTLGTPGMRSTMPNCTLMYHQPSWSAQGRVTDMVGRTSLVNGNKKAIETILSRHTGYTRAELAEMMREDFYMTASEAKAMNFVDHVSPPIRHEAAARLPDTPPSVCASELRRNWSICRNSSASARLRH
ncbi:MAG: ATP-dependent Clp protease proteolytic subunit [Rhodospirillales bacterium]|nr:ATP-dependent Clp protease proteolytic subunit [Alphaproteobacteria bacterium]MCB9987237.1 ATP-dependent Clp protease proteolytic subunit [Rhodospirillales bacterium]USO07902.1 MAG: ATP-dependent Clp protease proteolytic subunit [Rhodospirillales bacterium]